jgi:hypothetical protein
MVGVDREANVIRGYIVAQEGTFKPDADRGEFDKQSLRLIIKLMKEQPNGLKSRFAHPSLSNDGIGKFLGRAKKPRMAKTADGIAAVRADLHLDPTSLNPSPAGGTPLGEYVMDLAESDPGAFSSSLALQTEKETRLDKSGRPKLDDEGHELPPLWRPTVLHASDVVDEGAAVDSFLSAETIDGLPDAVVRQGAELLDRQFLDATREEISGRCSGWLKRYLDYRFGPEVATEGGQEDGEEIPNPTPALEAEGQDGPSAAEAEPYEPGRDAEKEIIRRRNRLRVEGHGCQSIAKPLDILTQNSPEDGSVIVAEVQAVPGDRILLLADEPVSEEIQTRVESAFRQGWESGKALAIECGWHIAIIRGCREDGLDASSGIS